MLFQSSLDKITKDLQRQGWKAAEKKCRSTRGVILRTRFHVDEFMGHLPKYNAAASPSRRSCSRTSGSSRSARGGESRIRGA